MLSADSTTPLAAAQALYESEDDDGRGVGAHRRPHLARREEGADRRGHRRPPPSSRSWSRCCCRPIYTARTTFLAPGSQQQSGSAAALAALGSLGGLAGGLGAKTPDELYVALLKSDSVQRGLDRALRPQGALRRRHLRGACARRCPTTSASASDKKSGVISVEVDDKDPKFAADLANAHEAEVTKLLGRLAVSEAQLRRVFFEKQLQETKENLIKAEQSLQAVQEKSGVIVLDKQAEALITSAALLRAQISEREVQLKVLRTSATEQNPAVMRLNSELRALRAELARMESTPGRRAGQRGRHAGRPDPGGGGRLRARAARAQAAGDAARRHGPPVRDRQARRGQGRPGAAAGRRRPAARPQVEAGARPHRPREHAGRRCCWSRRGSSSRRYVALRARRRSRPPRRPGAACVRAWSFRR